MNETARQPEGQWCWCDDPPENQPPHDCAEDHATRGACQYDGAHVHPSREWAERARKAQEAGPPASRLADDDQELAARARRLAEDGVRSAEAQALARELLRQMADRLDARPASYLDEAAAGVRVMLDANTARHKGHMEARSGEAVLQPIRAERLTIIDRLIAIGAAEVRAELRLDAPRAAVLAFCRRCEAGTASVPCPRCGGPACAGCGRCPPCDGGLPDEEE